MSHHRSFLSLLAPLALALAPLACASHPAAPPAAPSPPPATAFQQAAGGVTEAQGSSPDDDVVFVEKEHKDPATYGDAPTATKLQAEKSARPKPLD